MFFLTPCASGCSLQLSVFIYSCSQCASGTAARRPASPEAKECPLFLLLLAASLTLLAHTLSGAAGASAQPGPSRPAGHLGRLNPSPLTWTWTRSGSWERIHNHKLLRPGARKSRGSVNPADLLFPLTMKRRGTPPYSERKTSTFSNNSLIRRLKPKQNESKKCNSAKVSRSR